MKNQMLTRILVGLLLTGLFLTVWYFGGVVQYTLCSIIAFLCVYEFMSALKRKGYEPFALPAYIFALLAYPIQVFLGVYFMTGLLTLCIIATIIFRLANKNRRTEDLIVAFAAYLYPIMPLLFLILIFDLPNFAVSRIACLMVFGAPLLGDTFAYFIGSFFGKRKLCPHISPNKTIAGSVGGVIGGITAGIIIFYMEPLISSIWVGSIPDLTIISFVILGLLCGILGQIGDLFASCIKRWCDIKDFGSIFPGHGGMMDRVDSVLMCAPLVFMVFSNLSLYL